MLQVPASYRTIQSAAIAGICYRARLSCRGNSLGVHRVHGHRVLIPMQVGFAVSWKLALSTSAFHRSSTYRVQNDMFCMHFHLAELSLTSQGVNCESSEEKCSSSYMNSVRLANQGVQLVTIGTPTTLRMILSPTRTCKLSPRYSIHCTSLSCVTVCLQRVFVHWQACNVALHRCLLPPHRRRCSTLGLM